MPTRCNRWFLLQILLLAQHVSGTIMPIIRSWSLIQVVAACGISCFRFQVAGRVWSWGLCVRFEGCCNKICNKNNLLHLDGILFPCIYDLLKYQITNSWIHLLISNRHKTECYATFARFPSWCSALHKDDFQNPIFSVYWHTTSQQPKAAGASVQPLHNFASPPCYVIDCR